LYLKLRFAETHWKGRKMV